MSEMLVGIMGIVILLMLFLSGFEVGFSMALLGFLGFSYIISIKGALTMASHDIFDIFTSYGFSVLPIFVLMGQVSFNSGIAKRLYDSANKFIGHISGGLAMATVAACTAFGSICGSTTATAATFSSVAIPEMKRYNYSMRLSSGVVASSSVLGMLIPPSVTLIIYGMITEQSIGKLFMASIFPGLLIALFLLGTIYRWAKKNPTLAPKGEKYSWKARILSMKQVGFVCVVFLIVMGGISKGFFTPTEAGSIGVFAICVMAFMTRDLDLKGFSRSLKESLVSASMVIILIVGSTMFGHFIAVTKIPLYLADWILGLSLNRYIVLLLISFIYLLGGSIIDDLAFMVLATPILYPIVSRLGFDLIWFGILLQIVIGIGILIPPMAVNVFVVSKITNVSVWAIYRGIYPLLVGMAIVCVLITIFPQIVLYLPYHLK